MDEQRKWFLKMETTPGDNAAKTVETTAKDLSQFVKIADEVAASSERTDSNFERMSTMGKRGLTPILRECLLWVKGYQKALHATEKPFTKGRIN